MVAKNLGYLGNEFDCGYDLNRLTLITRIRELIWCNGRPSALSIVARAAQEIFIYPPRTFVS